MCVIYVANRVEDAVKQKTEEKLDQMSRSKSQTTQTVGMKGEFFFGLGRKVESLAQNQPLLSLLKNLIWLILLLIDLLKGLIIMPMVKGRPSKIIIKQALDFRYLMIPDLYTNQEPVNGAAQFTGGATFQFAWDEKK
jgi:hypothetical protein